LAESSAGPARQWRTPRVREGVRPRASKFTLALLRPRRLFAAYFVLNLLPFAVVVAGRTFTHPFAFFAYTEFSGLSSLLSLGALAVILASNAGLAMLVLSALVEREVADRLLLHLFVHGLLGLALGFVLGRGALRAGQPWFLERFVERTQPVVAALDAYVAEHNAPPLELAALVPEYIDRIPFGLWSFEFREREEGHWAFEVWLCDYAVGKEEVLALRPKQDRGTEPGMKRNFWKTYGPWDHWMGF